MADIIQVLPDAIANQIAAGEVVQRPASVVKELMENALDAGASKIDVIIEEAGKDLIQVIDNGCGMSQTDARMAFERHATSKIRKAHDLFSIKTMGFRGEALASIAAVANVELKSKKHEEELGTHIIINGSNFVSQESVSCANGSNFIIKNLFFNIPARRKFLKTNATELRHIINEFQRQALANPEVAFKLIHNKAEVFNLPGANQRQRIVNILGTNANTKLIKINSETEYVNISGFIGKPENAKKQFGEQFFFVNKRYMRHPYLHKAVVEAYRELLSPDTVPSYFIFINIDPEHIDVNIHPTKTEVKFEDERTLFQILMATVKESLGKFNIVPSIDFEQDQSIEIPIANGNTTAKPIEVKTNPDYNPFNLEKEHTRSSSSQPFQSFESKPRQDVSGWENLYEFSTSKTKPEPVEEDSAQQQDLKENFKEVHTQLFQVKGKYIFSQVKSGIMVIHQRRAHERILYDRFIKSQENKNAITQKVLFPHAIELSPIDFSFMETMLDDLNALGFDINIFGKNTLNVNGVPAGVELEDPKSFFEELIENFRGKEELKDKINEQLAKTLAKTGALNHRQDLSVEEMQHLIDSLFSCPTPNYTPDGKLIVHIIHMNEIDKQF